MSPALPQAADPVSLLESATMRRVAWRLTPLLCLLYLVAFIDRTNIAYAALAMGKEVGLSPSMFGFGAGIFFIGYFLFEVPSNLLLHRLGARVWIARVLVTWGVVSCSFAFVRSAKAFYILRFLLGVSEAGLFPGLILYLGFWFPRRFRGRVTAAFMTAIPIASFVAAPLSGILLQLDGAIGFRGWQWMFLIEGLPAVFLGGVVLKYLTDGPEKARWLAADQRAWLIARMADEAGEPAHHSFGEVMSTLVSSRVLRLGLVYFGLTTGLYGIELWMPQIIKGFGLSTLSIGFVGAIPYLVAIATMGLWAKHSDKTRERSWHVAIPCLTGATGLFFAGFCGHHLSGVIVLLSIAIAGVMAARPPFWTLPAEFLRGRQAAAGIAAVNSIGNLGGFAGPYLIGWTREFTGSFTSGLILSALMLLLSAGFVVSVQRGLKFGAVQDSGTR